MAYKNTSDLLRAAGLGLALLLMPSLTACGFKPLYAQNGLVNHLASVEVEAPNTRLGYLLRQNLITGLGDSDAKKQYSLEIKIDEKRYDVGLSVQGNATRFEISNVVNYVLKDSQSNTVLLTNGFVDTVTYDASENAYTGIASQQDGQARAATSIANRVQNELAVYFHNRS
jgi:LPS-assembly lipoprotein